MQNESSLIILLPLIFEFPLFYLDARINLHFRALGFYSVCFKIYHRVSTLMSHKLKEKNFC